MRENRTYGSEGGEVLTHLSDPIKKHEAAPALVGGRLRATVGRCPAPVARERAPTKSTRPRLLLWGAACGRQVYARSAASVARERAPTKNDADRPCCCGRPLAGDRCTPRAQPLSRESALPQRAMQTAPAFVGGRLRATGACPRRCHRRAQARSHKGRQRLAGARTTIEGNAPSMAWLRRGESGIGSAFQ